MGERLLPGTVLGAVLFVISLFLGIYSRSSHGLPNSFHIYLSIWPQLAVYFVLCVVAGCLIHSIVLWFAATGQIRRTEAETQPEVTLRKD